MAAIVGETAEPNLTKCYYVIVLDEFKAALALGYVRWVHRSDARKAHLSGLTVTTDGAVQCLGELSPDDYSRGPDPDDFAPERELWVFGRKVAGMEAYIKVALEPDIRRRTVVHAVIWSFHAADYPMKYPLRTSS